MSSNPGMRLRRPWSRLVLAALLAPVALLSQRAHPGCAADLDADGSVAGSDLGAVLTSWGPCDGCAADLDANGIVDGADLGLLLFAWGECPVTVPSWATLVESRPDPAVVTDAALRDAIAATGLAWRVRDVETQVEMLLVPPGTFLMGCVMGSIQVPCFQTEWPVHEVTLTRPFYLGRFELTQAQWTARMGSNPSSFIGASAFVPAAQVPNRPVERVSWTGAQSFLAPAGMRLPTEAEWEFACRAGTSTPFHDGSTEDATVSSIAWISAVSGAQTHPVGGLAANALGFHDMLGNVAEWVNDRFDGYRADPQTDPQGPESGAFRAVRGGSWNDGPAVVRSSSRTGLGEGSANPRLGFRVARDP